MDAAPRRAPSPRPFLIVLMVVAFFGGSCTVQKMMGPARDTPSEEEISKLLAAETDGEERDRLVSATRAMIEEQARVAERFHPYAVVFGLALVTLYSFAFVFGLRAYHFAAGAPKPLSRISLLILPARVAMAAVDLASAKALEPATRRMASAFTTAQRPELPPEQAQAVAQAVTDAAPWFAVAIQVASAVAVLVLFHSAWRYFQRPDVVAFFEKKAPAEDG